MSDWKPISTLPRDHSPVRVLLDSGNELTGWFYENDRVELETGFMAYMQPDPMGIAVSAVKWKPRTTEITLV